MERRIINPWQWQAGYGYVQANEVRGATHTLLLGQAANDEQARPSMPATCVPKSPLALDNLEIVLQQAGFTFADIMRLNIYTTDVDQFFTHYDAFIGRLEAGAGCQHRVAHRRGAGLSRDDGRIEATAPPERFRSRDGRGGSIPLSNGFT
jgi:enamine deaminase RidA (YjgF/YER057c/UK114 family)